MKKLPIYILLLQAVILAGCSADESLSNNNDGSAARELSGIKAYIAGTETSNTQRAGTVTPLAHYVGRDAFITGDQVVFTDIRRTNTPITEFTYPGNGDYNGIIFQAGSEGGWSRVAGNGPERVYWTDATSPHTFVAYSAPQAGFEWKTYKFTQESVNKTYYIGSLGEPTTDGDITYTEENLKNEDLLLSYDANMQAEPGGSVALVKFYHGLSSVRVVVNISGFSSTTSDHQSVVSDMKLLHQPTMYVWMQADAGAQPLRASRTGQSFTDQEMVNAAWNNGGSNVPAYDQRKNLVLWTPNPDGSGSGQSKTFTFYGITTPQPSDYINTLNAESEGRKVELSFKVTYPDPLKPSETVTKDYKASLTTVYFEAGFNTTINISLNHKNEKMTVGAEYENWQYVATPDVGELKKNSTFLQDTERGNVTILGDAKATIDDATWLYEYESTVYDIYGHDGTTAEKAYQISTAYQLLSFAYEVKNGKTFEGKYVRLDADLTLQKSATKTREEVVEDPTSYATALNWIGIGDETHPFNGTFLGGNRFIYRLKGSPLFVNIGSNAKIEQLQVQPLTIGNGTYTAINGDGAFAKTNAGMICGSKVVGDVILNGSTVGAFVGENTGKLFADYHVGLTQGTATTGGLVGTNSGEIVSCYQAGEVIGTTTGGIVGANTNTGTLENNFYNSTLLPSPTFSPESGVTGKTSNEMTKEAFVTLLNNGTTSWRTDHTGYDDYQYVYQPANYPKLTKNQ